MSTLLRSVNHVILLTLFVLLALLASQAHASSALKVSSIMAKPSETISVQVTGVTKEQMEYGAWIGFYAEEMKNDQYISYQYINELPKINMYTVIAPKEYGKYNFRLFLDEAGETPAAISDTVTIQAPQAVLEVDKAKIEPGKTIKVKVSQISGKEEYEHAWIGLYKQDAKNHQYVSFKYIKELSANNTWEVAVPKDLGKYQFRLFNDEEYKLSLGVGGAFEIIPYQSKLTLDKTTYKTGEEVKVQYRDESVLEDAWIGIYKSDSKDNQYIEFANLYDLSNNSYKIKISQSGSYQFRLFLDSEYVQTGVSPLFTVTSDGAAQYDVSGASDWAVSEINDAASLSLITETVMSEFQQDITREEFCELAVKLYEKMSGKTISPAPTNPFSDTSSTEILKAYELGIVKGVSENQFAPNNKVTRQEIAVMLFRTLKLIMPNMDTKVKEPIVLLDETDIASWALEAVTFFNAQGIMKGNDGTLLDAEGNEHPGVYILPLANTTREQSIALVKRIYEKYFGI